jgi:hypothetical protein
VTAANEPFTQEPIMASKNSRDQKPASDGKPAKKGEIKDGDLDKVTGGASASGLPTGKRMSTSADPCEGGR